MNQALIGIKNFKKRQEEKTREYADNNILVFIHISHPLQICDEHFIYEVKYPDTKKALLKGLLNFIFIF